jgi:hypothetical protein
MNNASFLDVFTVCLSFNFILIYHPEACISRFNSNDQYVVTYVVTYVMAYVVARVINV